MDDKLKNFLEKKDIEQSQGDKHLPKEEIKESSNKYDKFFEDGEELVDKMKDGLGKAGEFLGESLQETKEFLGESLKETGRFFKEGSEELKDFVEEVAIPKAKETKEKLDEKVEDWTEKLKDYSESPIKETPGSNLDEGLFDTHSGFFSKMEKFADRLEGKDKPKIIKVEQVEKVDNRPVKGFEDLDGDGNELIDDAIVED